MPTGDLFPESIETDRLRLEAIDAETVDVIDLYELCASDPGIEDVTRYVPWDPHESPKETVELVERIESKRDDHEGASYLVRPLESEDGAGDIAGLTGFGVDWEKRTMTLGVWLRKRFWGRGYSGERAGAFMTVAFDRLDLELVAVCALVDNEKSNRAIESYVDAHGGSRDGLLRNWVTVDDEPRDCYRYSVSRDEWADHSSDVSITVRSADAE